MNGDSPNQVAPLAEENRTDAPPYRLAVMVTDCVHAAHAGGDPIREVRTFPLPDVIKRYIDQARRKPYCTVTLTLDLSWIEKEDKS